MTACIRHERRGGSLKRNQILLFKSKTSIPRRPRGYKKFPLNRELLVMGEWEGGISNKDNMRINYCTKAEALIVS